MSWSRLSDPKLNSEFVRVKTRQFKQSKVISTSAVIDTELKTHGRKFWYFLPDVQAEVSVESSSTALEGPAEAWTENQQ